MRIGMGYDIHRLVRGRKLMLGGIPIPFELGLLGHSDADVLVHAVCDALLGAAGLGDIGRHFPDDDPHFKDISSLRLLARSSRMVEQSGYRVINLDATIMAQAPKIAPYGIAMAQSMARVMEISADKINIKATTTEGLGSIGRQKAIAAQCIVLIAANRNFGGQPV